MKNIKFALPLILISAITWAVVQGKGTVDEVNSPKPQWFQSGMYIGSRLKNPLSDTKNKVAYQLVGTKVWDFPSLGGTMVNGDTLCAESGALTIAGCAFNDTLQLGVDQAPVNEFGIITPYVSSADTVKVRACAFLTDGGSFNMPDASYTVRCTGD